GGGRVIPKQNVVQVGPAGLAARVPAPAVVPFAGGAADGGAGAAPPAAQGQDRAGVPVGHPRQGRGAGDHLRGGHADRRAILHVAPGRGRFRGNARRVRSRGRRAGEHAGVGVHHHLIHLGITGSGDLGSQERLRDGNQAVGQVRGRSDRRGGSGGLAHGLRVRGGRPIGARRVQAGRRFRGNV